MQRRELNDLREAELGVSESPCDILFSLEVLCFLCGPLKDSEATEYRFLCMII